MKKLIEKLEGVTSGITEEAYEPPKGFMTKKAKITVKHIAKSHSGIGVEFLIDGKKVYDDYLGDYVGSVQPEFFSDPLVKGGYSDEEIVDLAKELKGYKAGSAVPLPRPIKMTVSYLVRKPFSWK